MSCQRREIAIFPGKLEIYALHSHPAPLSKPLFSTFNHLVNLPLIKGANYQKTIKTNSKSHNTECYTCICNFGNSSSNEVSYIRS
ncbi:Hypothetical predicted protein [Octopus vulgaris]|uniref:Uncharacterized protein n=1 Tax=Octopus vulgaris TaxID=6645 RepID=A0AA36BX74_OCTVU|nr:Hypothetical predicted protein [Octopus vulgaris]